MSMVGDLAKNLLISSLFITLFCLVLVFSTTANDTEMFIATLGYAAFCAVFMGVAVEKRKGESPVEW